uniref:Uncharacterized protein n=1 Tax=Trieres chinensis TaxID=1514140 RepID=A0A7S1ZI09_TRICV
MPNTSVSAAFVAVLLLLADASFLSPSRPFTHIQNDQLHHCERRSDYHTATLRPCLRWPNRFGTNPLTVCGLLDGDDVAGPADTSPGPMILRLDLSVSLGADETIALEAVRSFVRSFPFSAVLPVQPLNYLPSDDGKGVRVSFLRKKTKEKGSIDGGIDFSIFLTDAEDNSEEKPEQKRIRVEARRDPKGQTVSKVFSEMLIMKAFVKAITGEDTERSDDKLSDLVLVESIFHEWM